MAEFQAGGDTPFLVPNGPKKDLIVFVRTISERRTVSGAACAWESSLTVAMPEAREEDAASYLKDDSDRSKSNFSSARSRTSGGRVTVTSGRADNQGNIRLYRYHH